MTKQLLRQENGLKCVVRGCDKPLKGRQTKYCSIKCAKFSDKHKNRHYYLEYHKKYGKKIRQRLRVDRICFICGATLPKYKKRYCSPTCQKIANNCDHEDIKYIAQEQYIPKKCPECMSTDIIKDGYDIVCKKCGLVVE